MKGQTFKSLNEQNEHLLQCEATVADTRIHGTTRRQVRKAFEESERAALLPLAVARFPFFEEVERKVNGDGHVEVDKSYYTAPPEYLTGLPGGMPKRSAGMSSRAQDMPAPTAWACHPAAYGLRLMGPYSFWQGVNGNEQYACDDFEASSAVEVGPVVGFSGASRELQFARHAMGGNGLNHMEFLELILEDELAIRAQRLMNRRVKTAAFRDAKTLEDFDFSFNPVIKKKQIFELATCKFIREARDVLLLGPPGTGKSHLAQAMGYQAIKSGHTVLYRSIFDVVRDFLHDEALGGEDKVLSRYLKPDLLIVDDMGMKQLPKRSGEYLFEIIMRRYENHSTIMTSNQPLEDWGKLIGDVPSATAILDRFIHHAEVITITGRSYRLRNKSDQSSPPKDAPPQESLKKRSNEV